jgi:hypothetical protein
MNRITKALQHRVAVTMAAAALLSGGPAFAFSSHCYTTIPPDTHDNTLAVRPNSSTHTLTLKIHTGRTAYTLVDNGNDVIIRTGRTGGGWHFETIGGLFNNAQGYILYCEGWVAHCELNNN